MLMKMKIALVVAGSLIAGVAVAGPHHGRRAEVIQKYDANKDGALSDQEKASLKADMKAKHQAKKQAMLTKFDTNKDGKLDGAERQVARDTRMTERFQKLDADGNGSISLAEFKAGKQGKQGRFGGMHRRGGMKRGL